MKNEVFEGSSRILDPQTPGIKIWSHQLLHGVYKEQNETYFTVKLTIFEGKIFFECLIDPSVRFQNLKNNP